MDNWKVHLQPPRRGLSHIKSGDIPCQDGSYYLENDDMIVVVIADGLGQLKHSEYAAKAVTKDVAEFLLHYTGNYSNITMLKKAVLTEAKNSINNISVVENIERKEMDSTLLFLIIMKTTDELIYGKLGDGAICFITKDSSFNANFDEDVLKGGSNFVKTIGSSDALDHFYITHKKISDELGFILTTDGLENEMYSRAGKVRKKVEWYFNIVSNKNNKEAEKEISTRWDELTADESYGFTDDMSCIIITKPNKHIVLPEEATWLCVCGNRNRLESTRCEVCNKDFLKIYKGINFKSNGGSKKAFFEDINENYEREVDVLKEHSTYPIEFHIEKMEEPIEKINITIDEIKTLKERKSTDDELLEKEFIDDEIIYSKPQKIEEKDVEKITAYEKKIEKKSYLNLIIVLLIAIILAEGIYIIYQSKNNDIIMALENEKKELNKKIDSLSETNQSLTKEVENLKSENDFKFNKMKDLGTEIAKLQYQLSEMPSLYQNYGYFTFKNGDVYIGTMFDEKPNGIGTIYAKDALKLGQFKDGMKEGIFYFLFRDGHLETFTFEKDKLVVNEKKSLEENKENE